ncbi:hypothetical protein CVS40_11125 [Lucilia cuprina]|nr:hypothetical protein CVS40_11125 [Lucilia cuprina]
MENKQLKHEVQSLINTVKYLNDQRLKYDCLVSGVEASLSAETVVKLTSDAGVQLDVNTIDDAYFIRRRKNNQKKNEKQILVVKFNSKRGKDNFMSVKPILKLQYFNIQNEYVDKLLLEATSDCSRIRKSRGAGKEREAADEDDYY